MYEKYFVYLSSTKNGNEHLELLEAFENRKSAIEFIQLHCDAFVNELLEYNCPVKPVFFGNEYRGGYGYKISAILGKYTLFLSNGRVFR